MSLEQAQEFLERNELCVIASVHSEGQPQAATVGFSSDDKLSIFIGTNRKTRKYQNLKSNSNVAVVVTEGATTVQYEGVAEDKSAEEIEEKIEKHLKKVPAARKFAGEDGQVWFLITPTWLRYSDLRQNIIEEFTEFP